MDSLLSFEDFCNGDSHGETIQLWVNADEGAMVLDYNIENKNKHISVRLIKESGDVEIYGVPIKGMLMFLKAIEASTGGE